MMRSRINAGARTEVARTGWAWWIATFFRIGFLRPGPGTWASAATVLLYYVLVFRIPHLSSFVALAICVVATAIGIPSATIVSRESGIHDPGFVVIDEVAGQALALAAAPFDWKYAIASFILFRGFDIVKPPPIRMLERLPEGTGIVVDDLGAGAYAAILLLVIRHFHLL